MNSDIQPIQTYTTSRLAKNVDALRGILDALYDIQNDLVDEPALYDQIRGVIGDLEFTGDSLDSLSTSIQSYIQDTQAVINTAIEQRDTAITKHAELEEEIKELAAAPWALAKNEGLQKLVQRVSEMVEEFGLEYAFETAQESLEEEMATAHELEEKDIGDFVDWLRNGNEWGDAAKALPVLEMLLASAKGEQ